MVKREKFEALARAYWTEERQKNQLGDKNLLVSPHQAAWLWRQLEIMHPDASLSHQGMRKLLQVNHLLRTLEPKLREIAHTQEVIDVVDLCCGKSYLSMALAWLVHVEWKKKCRVLALDANAELCTKVRSIVDRVGLGACFRTKAMMIEPVDVRPLFAELFGSPASISLALALHACDTATDDALAAIDASEVPTWAVAPCCQAELAQLWSQRSADHPMLPVFLTPQLRRDVAAEFTDAQRMLIMRQRHYEVTMIEFTGSEHTAKNRLLVGQRKQATSSVAAFSRFVEHCGGDTIKLAKLLNPLSS